MNISPHTIALADAEPGERLAEAVVDDNGNVLVGAGCELTAGMIQSMIRRGVKTLCVARPAVIDEAECAARYERARARITHLFRHATKQGRLNPLMHSVLAYRLEGLS